MKPNEIKGCLVRNSKGVYYYFYINNNSEIQCNTYDEKGLFIEELIIVKKGVMNFSATIDSEDNIHLIVINNKGDVVHFLHFKEKWSMKNIHNFTFKDNYCNNLKIYTHKGNLDVYIGIVTLFPYKTWNIYHLKYDGDNKAFARVLMSRNHGAVNDFNIDYDNRNNIHILFKNIDIKNYQAYYNINNPFTNTWGEVITNLSNSNSNVLDFYMFSDSDGFIHSTWSELYNGLTNLVYKRKDPFSNHEDKWSFYSLPKDIGNIKKPIIFSDNGYLRILYIKENVLKGYYSRDSGNSWHIDKFFNNLAIEDFTLISYSSNYMFTSNDTKIKDIYGKITDEYILLYDGDIKEKINHLNTLLFPKEEFNDTSYKKDERMYPTSSPENKDVSSVLNKEVLESKENNIESIIASINISLDTVLDNFNVNDNVKEELRKLIDENLKISNESVELNINNIKEFTIKLESIEDYIHKFKLENKKVLNLLTSINDIYQENIKRISNIETKIDEVKEEVKRYENQGLLSKLKNIFK